MLSYCKDPKFMIGKLTGMSQSSCWVNGGNTEDRAGRLGHASASPPGSHPHSCHPHRLCRPELASLLPPRHLAVCTGGQALHGALSAQTASEDTAAGECLLRTHITEPPVRCSTELTSWQNITSDPWVPLRCLQRQCIKCQNRAFQSPGAVC